MSIYTCGELDIYDNQNGSVLLSWPPFGGGVPDSFNIYVNGALVQNGAYGPVYLQLETGGDLLLESSGKLVLESGSTPLPIVSGLTQASYSAGSVSAATGNSLRPQNMPPIGEVTPSGTYLINVVAVSGGIEVASSAYAKVTAAPASIMLKTPMKRLWPFPNTGLD